MRPREGVRPAPKTRTKQQPRKTKLSLTQQVQRQKLREEAKEEFAAAQMAEAQYQATIQHVYNSAPPVRSFGVKQAQWFY